MHIHYVEIENYKTFGDKIRINFNETSVVIGPNNSGKTSAIQALALWSRGIREWHEKKGQKRLKEPLERFSAGINRLNILEVPVAENKFFWKDTRVRKGNTLIELSITAGVNFKNNVEPVKMVFTYRDSEVIYCKPCPETRKKEELIGFAAKMNFCLLYPMSGIMAGVSAETEETPLTDGRINVFLGQGQTAQVLRNICFKIIETDKNNNSNDWDEIVKLVDRLFVIELGRPYFNETRGSLILGYRQKGINSELDISLAGRGQQQVLLILAYLFWHKNSILLIDEPDAHLEILRQRQVFDIIKHIAVQNGSQVIIATHSEVILDDAVDINLTLLIDGKSIDLASKNDIRNSLRTYGIEHYYNALLKKRVLYIEGSSDVKILREFACKLNHPVLKIFDDSLYCYYTQDVSRERTLESDLDRNGGFYSGRKYKEHFKTLKSFIPELKGIAIFDSDNKNRADEIENDFAVLYWKNYDAENYIITPELLINYIDTLFSGDLLFAHEYHNKAVEIIKKQLLAMKFNGNEELYLEYEKASPGLKQAALGDLKMSEFGEIVFEEFMEKIGLVAFKKKSEFYSLISLLDKKDIANEITEKLDFLYRYLS